MEGLKFPGHVPVLYFLSKNNTRMIPSWRELHENLVQDKDRSKTVLLSGSNYVYYGHGNEIVKISAEWILNRQEFPD